MKRLMELILTLLVFVSVQPMSWAGNLVCGATGPNFYLKQIKETQTRLDSVDAALEKLEKLDSLSPGHQKTKEELIKERKTLLTTKRLLEGLMEAQKSLMDSAVSGRVLVFDAPEGTTHKKVDYLADRFGLDFEKSPKMMSWQVFWS